MAIVVAFLVFAYALVYYVGPGLKEQHWFWITPGSVVGVTLWVLASVGLPIYSHFFNSYSKS